MAGCLRVPLPAFRPPALCLVAALALAMPAFPAGVIYRYTDEHGAAAYTDAWERIPEAARSGAQVLDGDTLEPVRPGPAPAPAGSAPLPGAGAPADSHAQPAAPSVFSVWLSRFAELTIPLLSEYQLGVGLTSLILAIWGIVILRMSANPLVKLFTKIGLFLLAGGAAYAMLFSGLNERITRATGKPAHPAVTGKELIQGVEAASGQATDRLKHVTVDRLKGVVEKAKDATLGEATRTVEQANEANRRLDEQLRNLDPLQPGGAAGSP